MGGPFIYDCRASHFAASSEPVCTRCTELRQQIHELTTAHHADVARWLDICGTKNKKLCELIAENEQLRADNVRLRGPMSFDTKITGNQS